MEKVLALASRDFKRIRLWKSYVLLLLIPPVAYLLFFSVAMSSSIQGITYGGKQLSYLAFVLPGLLAMQAFSQYPVQIAHSANDKRWGIFRALMTAGVRAFEYIWAQVINRMLVIFFQAMAILLVGGVLSRSFPITIHGYVMIFITLLVSGTLWTLLGIMMGVRIDSEEKRDALWVIFNLPVMFSSSVFYDIQRAPTYVVVLSHLNPLTYTADLMRAAFYGDPFVEIGKLVLLLAMAIVIYFACLHVVKNIELVPGAK